MLRGGSHDASFGSTAAPASPRSSPTPPMAASPTPLAAARHQSHFHPHAASEGDADPRTAHPPHLRVQTSGSRERLADPPPCSSREDLHAAGPAPAPPVVASEESRHRPVQEYHSAFVADASLVSGASPSFSSSAAEPPPHRRQHSIPSLLPIALINRATSPERRLWHQNQQPQRPGSPSAQSVADMPLTGEGRRTNGRNSDATLSARSGLSGWFSGGGASSPSSPNSRPADQALRSPGSVATTPDATPTRNTPTDAQHKRSLSQSSSRFGFLASGMSALSSVLNSPSHPTSPARPADENDELSSMNVEAALFPQGPPTERDTFSPAAFKNLQLNSVALARRLQAAYRGQAAVARELAADRGAQRDELEEVETRAEHLKMQLEGMAAKAADQEQAMRRLAEELAAERRKTAKLLASGPSGAKAEDWRRSQQLQPPQSLPVGAAASEGSISEDLGVDAEERRRRRGERQNWRGSGATAKSELSFDTDDESVESESVFSRSRSPTIAQGASDGSGSSNSIDPPSITVQQHPKITALRSVPPQQPLAAKNPSGQNQQPMTAFQKLVKNVTGAAKGDDDAQYNGPGCRNCKGQDASIAWNTVSLLRDENRGLKQRVGQLEVAVDGALDLVNGVGL